MAQGQQGITRFKQRLGRPSGSGFEEVDGPVSGAIQVISIACETGTNQTKNLKVDIPPGMRFRLMDAAFRASSVSGTPTIAVGLSVNGSTKLVNTVAVSTNQGALTVKTASQNIEQNRTIRVTLAAALATRQIVGGVLTLVGHVSQPPSSLVTRSFTHF